jgi:glycosyltransferase involved in cell wall biosynthesis
MNIYLIYLSNNYGGACQALLAFKKFLDSHEIKNQVICPQGPLLIPDIEISSKKYKSIFKVLFFILFKNIFYKGNKNIFFLNTIANAPLSIFKNTILWIHETTLDGRPNLFSFLKFLSITFSRESYFVNSSMHSLFPKSKLFEIPYKYLENVVLDNSMKRSKKFKACMIVRPLDNKGIDDFIRLSSRSPEDFAILTQPNLFILYCHKNGLNIPNNLAIEDFNDTQVRKRVLLSSSFHLNLSKLPETVGLNTIEAMSYGCICISTDNAGSRLILDEKFIIKNPLNYDLIESVKLLMSNYFLEDLKTINRKQLDKVFCKNSKLYYRGTFLEDELNK